MALVVFAFLLMAFRFYYQGLGVMLVAPYCTTDEERFFVAVVATLVSVIAGARAALTDKQ